MKKRQDSRAELERAFRSLKLPSFLSCYEGFAQRAEKEGWSFAHYLHHLASQELEDRRTRKIERLEQQSRLPTDKTLATLDLDFPALKVRRQLATLCEGEFAAKAINVLMFGLPGRGKSHLSSAVGHELVRRGIPVLYMPTYRLVQDLLRAKRDLTLEKAMRRLDRFDVVVLDDFGYVEKEQGEMEVLFTFIAERYERRSLLITSNLVFSQWDRIFKDPMTTQAAVDRLVHHSIVVELTGPSYRAEAAKKQRTNARAKAKGGQR